MKRDTKLEQFAESITEFGPDARLLSGEAAAAHGRAVLETALGGPAQVEEAIRGRPPLTGVASRSRRGYRSPQRSFRLPEMLDEQLTKASTTQGRRQSDIVRDALTEYFEKHSA